ncbi:hypothetical protein J4461_00545 [Candidatus Pacearchaeota archaeon]|nr:hypothetical protein [Candidatus Pacearchaeota archaeon]
MKVEEALQELRKQEKRNFEQSVDMIINLKDIDPKRDNISALVTLPNRIRDKKVCAFLTKKSNLVDTITAPEFPKYKDKKDLRKLVKSYDFFIAAAKLMPSVATTFGKALGPTGKMPSPQLGVLMNEEDSSIKTALSKIDSVIKIRVKEPAIKVSIGKEGMSDEQIISNVKILYQTVIAALPVKKDNVKSVMLKLTMSKPLKVENIA